MPAIAEALATLRVKSLTLDGEGVVPRKAGKDIRLSEHIGGADGATVFQHACRMGLEGIVAKRRDRPYRSGRSTDWIKIKNPDTPAATGVIEG